MIVFIEAYSYDHFDIFNRYFHDKFKSKRTVTIHKLYQHFGKSGEYIAGRIEQIMTTNVQYRYNHVFLVLGGLSALRHDNPDYAMYMQRIFKSEMYKHVHIYIVIGNLIDLEDPVEQERKMKDITDVFRLNVANIMDDQRHNAYNLLFINENQSIEQISNEIVNKLMYHKVQGKSSNSDTYTTHAFDKVRAKCIPITRKSNIKTMKILVKHQRQLEHLRSKKEKVALMRYLNYTPQEIASFFDTKLKNVMSLISRARTSHLL